MKEQTDSLGANNEPNLKYLPLESSHLESAAHNGKNTLYIKFHSGDIWSYNPVNTNGYMRFLKAESQGKYFHDHIKNNSLIKATRQNG